ncbi:MAG: PAS domain S-box protein [Elusimicrobiota bacterium]|jgi:PAS domain S-box-containing protein
MLRLQSNSFRMLCEFTPHPIWVVDPVSQYFLEVNEAAREKYGYSRDEFLSQKVQAVHLPEDAARLQECLSSAQGPKQRSASFRQRTKDGRTLDMEVMFRPMEFDGRRAVICVGSDVTDKVRSEKDLQRHALAMESSLDGMAILGPDETYEYVNTAHAKVYGYDAPGDLIGKSWKILYDADELKRFETEVMPALYREGRWIGEAVGLRKDGTRFRQELSLSSIAGGGLVCVVRDVVERVRSERLLQRQRVSMETAVDGVGIREGERIVFANDSLARMHGYGKGEELIGRAWQELYPEAEVQRLARDVVPSFLRERRWRGEAVGRRRDGTTFLQDVSITMIEDDVVVSVMRDVTEQKRAAEQLSRSLLSEKAARLEAEQASRAKDEFLAILSHEMRTPMTAMLGWTWLMKTGALDGEAREKALDTVHRNMQQQSQIIEDLLDVSRIVTGKLKLETCMLDLRAAVEASLDAVRPAAEAKSIRLSLSGEDGLPPVLGDPDRLQQVFWNLLSNAVKFTPEGGEVRIELGRAGSRLQVRITDNGQGIASEHLGLVFDRFRQAEEPLTRKYRGLGLGLAIVKLLVEAHGGVVEAASAGVGRGSSFSVQLPVPALRVDALPPRPRTRGEARAKLPRLEGLRVLVVDDDEGSREIIAAVLRQCGAAANLAGGAEEAFTAFTREKPDVLVTDVGLSDEDGYALIRKVRALDAKKGGQVPAVALTVSNRGDEHARLLLSGFQLYVRKPVEPVELAAAVAALSGRSLTDSAKK